MFKIALVSGFIATLARAYILYGLKKKSTLTSFRKPRNLEWKQRGTKRKTKWKLEIVLWLVRSFLWQLLIWYIHTIY